MIGYDLIGKKFNRLTVLEKTTQRKRRSIVWKCLCDCGNITYVTSTNIIKGFTKSCGCYRKEKAKESNTKHGLSNTKLFMVWQDMISRCNRKSHHAYKYYGKRGIKVCEEWVSNFVNFYKWAINTGYKEGLTIDRIDNDGDYQPDNCRWVTMKVQCQNKRKSDLTFCNNPNSKRVVKLTLDDKYIQSYDCIKNAMIDNKINLLSSSISTCCKHKQKSAYGYKWMYEEEWKIIEDKFGEYLK